MNILVTEDKNAITAAYKIALQKRNHEVVITDDREARIKMHKFFIHSELQPSANIAIKVVNER